MPSYTTNLNLEKPNDDEQFNIATWNANSDKIDNFAGQTPARALTADKLTTGAKINNVTFTGETDITLPVATNSVAGTVLPDGETIIIDNDGTIHGVNQSANKDLSNLSINGESKLHALKGYYENGTLYSDSQLYNDVYKYAHSTFDIAKFTVVGSPTVTSDGIVSSWSNSNKLTCSVNGSGSVNYEIHYRVLTPQHSFTSSSSTQTNALNVTNIGATSRNLYLYGQGNALFIAGCGFGYTQITNDISIDNIDYVDIVIKNNGTTVTATAYDPNGNPLKPTITSTDSGSTLGLNNSTFQLTDGNFMTATPLFQIDEKYCDVIINGVSVFNGNKSGTDSYTINGSPVSIPYVLSSTGSKIVDVAYIDDVKDVYDEYGKALYYIIDETNQKVALPLGEVYGFITTKQTTGDWCVTTPTTDSTASLEKPVVIVENYKNGSDWYEIYSDGSCRQGSSEPVSATYSGTSRSITLLKPYKDNEYSVLLTKQTTVGMLASSYDTITAKTTTDFTIGATCPCDWEARGYIS